MPAPAVRSSDVSTYSALFRRVKETLLEGQRRIEQEKKRTYWETGGLILAHIMRNERRADYGSYVVLRLAEDLQVHESLIRRCVEFARVYKVLPIRAGRHELTWSHYRQLIAIADNGERESLERMAVDQQWTAEELGERIKAGKYALSDAEADSGKEPNVPGLPAAVPESSLNPLKGTLYTYRIIKPKTLNTASELQIDLGFSIVRNVEPRLVANFRDGDIVASIPKEDAYRFAKSDRTARDLYTYQAFVERVTDGDTLKVRIDLGFDTWVRQTLRLRAIDCPELATKSGEAAKAFVQSYIKEADRIVVRSSWSDKYGRYLADIFLTAENGEEVFLNGLLLEKGHAERC